MSRRYIEFLSFTYLRGPSLWTYRPVVEALVDIGDLEECPSDTVPGLPERLTALLPGLVEHRCSYGERGGFLRRVEEGTWPAHMLEHVTVELQNLAGMTGGFGRARSTSTRGVYKVMVRAWHEEVTRTALHLGRDLLMAAIDPDTHGPFDVAAAVAALRELADDLLLGPSTQNIFDAATAKDRRVPAIRLNEGNLVQLGYGARARRIWTAETDATSAIGADIARDKDLTKRLLADCGLPVPQGVRVDSPEAAWTAAQTIGLPVVLKPLDGNHGRGVSVDLSTSADVKAAYGVAEREGTGVICERFVRGVEHRLLVVGGQMLAAARGEEAWVTGDGRTCVTDLIDAQLNSDPRRGLNEDYPLNMIRIEYDPAVALELERQGLIGESIPAEGRRVLIQRNGNVAFDCTDEVHPETAAIVVRAARCVGLDIAGIDLVAEDISRPLGPQGGAIVEVNAGPGLIMHLRPAAGLPRPVGRAIVDYLFPDGADGRIPVVGISGTRGKTRVARILDEILNRAGRRVGLACSDGLFVERRPLAGGDCAHWGPAQRLLINPEVEVAIIENGPEAMLREGLAYDRCQVGVITNIDPSQIPVDGYVDSPERLCLLLRTQVDVVLPTGLAVLNAADPLVAAMAPLCDGEVILFAADPAESLLAAHLGGGGRALSVAAGQVVLLGAGPAEAVADLADLGSAGAGVDLDSLLAAVAGAWAMGLTAEAIRDGVASVKLNCG
jgi:cyanophycin synthetase